MFDAFNDKLFFNKFDTLWSEVIAECLNTTILLTDLPTKTSVIKVIDSFSPVNVLFPQKINKTKAYFKPTHLERNPYTPDCVKNALSRTQRMLFV